MDYETAKGVLNCIAEIHGRELVCLFLAATYTQGGRRHGSLSAGLRKLNSVNATSLEMPSSTT
jgi:hypothetical protein